MSNTRSVNTKEVSPERRRQIFELLRFTVTSHLLLEIMDNNRDIPAIYRHRIKQRINALDKDLEPQVRDLINDLYDINEDRYETIKNGVDRFVKDFSEIAIQQIENHGRQDKTADNPETAENSAEGSH